MFLRPTYIQINTDCLKHNLTQIKNRVYPAMVCAVVKADGYGHGLINASKAFVNAGADMLAVATPDEAIEVKQNISGVKVLLLGAFSESAVESLILEEIRLTVFNIKSATLISETAQRIGKTAICHLKLDTGMNRLGFRDFEELQQLKTFKNIEFEGVFSHFSCADHTDKTYSHSQANRFFELIKQLENIGFEFKIKHISNSAAILDLPEYNLDMVRPGIICYGLYPSNNVNKNVLNLREAMELHSRVVQSRQTVSGSLIGYSGKYITSRLENILTIPIGYADGLSRSISGKAKVSIKGKLYPIVGNICMDQLMVSADDIKEGEGVVLLGEKYGLPIEGYAMMENTIPYEIICHLGKRMPKLFVGEEK